MILVQETYDSEHAESDPGSDGKERSNLLYTLKDIVPVTMT